MPFLGRCAHLSGLGVFGGVVVPAHAEHVLRAVVELREAVELAVAVVDAGLVDAAEGSLRVVGAVEKRLEDLSALVKVPRASQVESLRGRPDLVLQVSG